MRKWYIAFPVFTMNLSKESGMVQPEKKKTATKIDATTLPSQCGERTRHQKELRKESTTKSHSFFLQSFESVSKGTRLDETQ